MSSSSSADREVKISVNPSLDLAGSLSGPSCDIDDNDKPGAIMVVFVAGSGPIDRDENVWMQKLNVFNTIAHHLAETNEGIPSFRYDKRGTGKSGGKLNTAGMNDLLDDLLAVIDYLRKEYPSTKLLLMGHSEGTLLSAMASAKRPNDVDSLVLLCPFVTPMETILKNQAAVVEKTLREATGISGWLQRSVVDLLGLHPAKMQSKLIAKVKETDAPTTSFFFQTVPALWLREHFAQDYEQVYRSVTVPTNIVVAGFDKQCDPADGDRILQLMESAGTSGAVLTTISNLSHLLRKEETNTGFSGYEKQIKKPVDEEVLAVASEWCEERRRLSADSNVLTKE